MRQEFKDGWLNALRSGVYAQAQGYLYLADTGGYCCLGVLCRTMGATWGHTNDTMYGAPKLDDMILSKGGAERLSPAVLDIVGITVQQEQKLIDMNDQATPHSFFEIADYIEKHL